MIVKMEVGADEQACRAVQRRAEDLGLEAKIDRGERRKVIAIHGGETGIIDTQIFQVLAGVEGVIRIMEPYKLSSREFRKEDTVVRIDDIEIGGKGIVIMAGPCAVENRNQIISCAKKVKQLGGKILRGGAFKPRTSPDSFRGLGEEGLKLLAEARKETGLLVVTEVMSPEEISLVTEYADILQIGSRNMQNYRLLEKAGETGMPILLKRHFSAKLKEWLAAADYILRRDSSKVILCARGIRTFEESLRFTPDIGIIPAIKRFSHLPVIFDPSHPAGDFRYVPQLARAGIAVGADGLLIEVHPDPKKALSDGAQSLTFSDFDRLMEKLKIYAEIEGRTI